MRYLWTEDTGAGLHFWQLASKLLFNNTIVVESKCSNQGILDAVSSLSVDDEDIYYIAFDYVSDNQDIRNKYKLLRKIANESNGRIVLLNMICFEYLILAFDKLIEWTDTGKKEKIQIREDILNSIEKNGIVIDKISDKKTIRYISSFKNYSTERVLKALVGELTENEKWSVRGNLMGDCWYQDCCISEHPDNLRCGEPNVKIGDEKMKVLLESVEVQKVVESI